MVKYGDLDLQNEIRITTKVNHRASPFRQMDIQNVSRRQGSKILGSEFTNKTIGIEGVIIAPTASSLVGLIDDMHKYLALEEQQLQLDDNRAYVATCTKVQIDEAQYSRSYANFDLEFICTNPFAEGNLRSVGFNIPASTTSITRPVTISGTIYAEPVVTLRTASGAGNSGITSVKVQHYETGNYVTVSGIFSLGSIDTVINHDDNLVTLSGTNKDFVGAFSRFPVGVNNLVVTLGGVNTYGATMYLTYNPRYLA